MREERGLFSTAERWRTNVQEMMGQENRPSAIITVKIGLGANHWRMLKLRGSLLRNRVFSRPCCLPTDCLLALRMKIVCIQWKNWTTPWANGQKHYPWETGRQHTSSGATGRDTCHLRSIQPRMQHLNLSLRECETNPNRETFCTIAGPSSSKGSKSWKTKKAEEPCQVQEA